MYDLHDGHASKPFNNAGMHLIRMIWIITSSAAPGTNVRPSVCHIMYCVETLLSSNLFNRKIIVVFFTFYFLAIHVHELKPLTKFVK